LPLPEGARARDIFALAADAENKGYSAKAEAAGRAAMAAVQIAKLSRSLPAVLAAKVTNINSDLMHSIVAVEADAVERFAANATKSLAIASEASIPLASGTAARFVVFRDTLGGDQVAVIVGKPNFAEPVPVRLHSACLTGDVFGSRRCDCGDQLRLALIRLKDLGGGVILYLAQEGRGIGLANEIRAYRLQDAGLDTRDANTMLGFEDDERDYGVAALMLRTLNCTRMSYLQTIQPNSTGSQKQALRSPPAFRSRRRSLPTTGVT
jgi:GTP cyclohydrolase II